MPHVHTQMTTVKSLISHQGQEEEQSQGKGETRYKSQEVGQQKYEWTRSPQQHKLLQEIQKLILKYNDSQNAILTNKCD